MGPVDYRDLLRHMEWADARTWSAVLGVASLQDDPQIRERLLHYHTTQWAYLQIWRREPVQIPQPSSFADLQTLGQWARAFYHELPSFLDGIDWTMLGQPIEFPGPPSSRRASARSRRQRCPRACCSLCCTRPITAARWRRRFARPEAIRRSSTTSHGYGSAGRRRSGNG